MTEQRTGSDVSEGFNFHNRPNLSSTRDSENVGDTQNTAYLDWTAHASRPTFSTFTRFLPTTIAGEGCSEIWTDARTSGDITRLMEGPIGAINRDGAARTLRAQWPLTYAESL